MFGKNAEECSPHQKKKQNFINVYPSTFFEVQTNKALTSVLQIFIYADTQKPYYIDLQMKMKTLFTNAFVMLVKSFTTNPPQSNIGRGQVCNDSSGGILG